MTKAIQPKQAIAPSPDERELYDISAVCRLTGLTAANLRAWERRYGVVEPRRSESGRRQYTEADVQRLTLLKNLADRGHPISSTCSLDGEQLEKRLREAMEGAPTGAEPNRSAPEAGGCRVVVVGARLPVILGGDSGRLDGAVVVAEFPDLDSAESGGLPRDVDLFIVEVPALFPETPARVRQLIRRTGAIRAIVLYQFAQSGTVEELEDGLGLITPMRAPISAGELRVACAADIALANRRGKSVPGEESEVRGVTSAIPERQFTDVELAHISRICSAIECECPQHLASLLASLVGFEEYSAQCENRNEADAEMHAYLHRMTAHARAIVEDSLGELVRFEGIDLEAMDRRVST